MGFEHVINRIRQLTQKVYVKPNLTRRGRNTSAAMSYHIAEFNKVIKLLRRISYRRIRNARNGRRNVRALK